MIANDRGPTATGHVERLDLVAVVGYAIVASVVILTGIVSGPLRALIAAPLLGFCPGYAVVSALLPATTPHPGTGERHPRWRHRGALGFATSLIVLVLAGVALTPIGYGPVGLVGVVLAITVVAGLVAEVRRRRVPTVGRLRIPLDRVAADVRDGTARSSGIDRALNVALALAVVTAMATLAVGLAAPGSGEAYSEIAFAGDGTPGNESYAQDEQATLTLEVENQEGSERSYAAVVVLERFADRGDGATPADPAILERAELSRTTLSVPDGETTTTSLEFAPELIGEELRLSVYVYTGEAPETATSESAEYHLYRWIDVEDGASSLAAPTTGDVEPSGA